MGRRRRQSVHEEQDNRDRWLVSYADFITLLFAFFVVMYSISSINDGKYRVLSNTLTDAFLTEATTMDPIQVGELVRSLTPASGEHAAREAPAAESAIIEKAQTNTEESQEQDPKNEPRPLKAVKEDLASALEGYISKDLVEVTQTDRGIEVEMKSKMLFGSGSARLSSGAVTVLRDVAAILTPIKNLIHVEGHTDTVPISTLAFPSNWELSAARAASVVNLFAKLGVGAKRMAAIGYGEYRPVVGNHLAEGRQKNRRVSLIIMARVNEKLKWEPSGGSLRGVQ